MIGAIAQPRQEIPVAENRKLFYSCESARRRPDRDSDSADPAISKEVLSSRGYASALVTDTYHMHRAGYNCGRGFDTTIAFVVRSTIHGWWTGR